MNGVFHLYRQRLIDNVGPVDSTVIHINLDLLTKQLLTFIPKNRVNIHSHARIFWVINQWIAYSLHIRTIHTYFMISFHQPVQRICIQVIGNHLQSITMHKKTVTLRIVNGHGTLGSKSRVGQFVIETVIARQHVLVDRICHFHIVECFTISGQPVIK